MSATGIFNVPVEDYHADDVGDQPSLSASIAKILVAQSPKHAWIAHPRLNPGFERVAEEKFDIGTAAHALLLEGESRIEVIAADDWRTKVAKEQRDEARAAGKIPLLAKNAGDVVAMVAAAREQLAVHEADPRPFTEGAAEQTLVWNEAGVVCRARLDWLHDGNVAISDYKTTGRSADPDAWVRSSLFGMGYDVQASFYLRGLSKVAGTAVAGMASFRFVVQETSPPYALSVVEPGPDVLALADLKVRYAIELWRCCLRDDDWPAYSKHVATAELPAWEDARWLEKHGVQEAA